MCRLFCIFNMKKTNQKLIKYGCFTSFISCVVAVGSLGVPGAQEATVQTQTFILEAGYGRVRLGRVQ